MYRGHYFIFAHHTKFQAMTTTFSAGKPQSWLSRRLEDMWPDWGGKLELLKDCHAAPAKHQIHINLEKKHVWFLRLCHAGLF